MGGGIMGSATAYFLMKYDDTLRVAVVERDPSYTHASTTLCAANVRIQFSLKENIQILDGNAIVGEWPERKGFFLANGFSGHGFQQAPAVGRYLAELILGRPLSLDLSIFSPNEF